MSIILFFNKCCRVPIHQRTELAESTYNTFDGDLKLENTKANQHEQEEHIEITFLQLLKSTLAAFIGVQSNANRERDFKHGKISHFIGIGLLFGLLFVCSIIGVVSLVMKFTGN